MAWAAPLSVIAYAWSNEDTTSKMLVVYKIEAFRPVTGCW
jgi:hypothetical protein